MGVHFYNRKCWPKKTPRLLSCHYLRDLAVSPWYTVYIMSVYGCFGLPSANSWVSDLTIFCSFFFFVRAKNNDLQCRHHLNKGCYISNTCFKQLTNYNKWGQLTNQSRLGFSESMPLKRQVLKQSISGRGWKGVQGSQNPMSQGYYVFQWAT